MSDNDKNYLNGGDEPRWLLKWYHVRLRIEGPGFEPSLGTGLKEAKKKYPKWMSRCTARDEAGWKQHIMGWKILWEIWSFVFSNAWFSPRKFVRIRVCYSWIIIPLGYINIKIMPNSYFYNDYFKKCPFSVTLFDFLESQSLVGTKRNQQHQQLLTNMQIFGWVVHMTDNDPFP